VRLLSCLSLNLTNRPLRKFLEALVAVVGLAMFLGFSFGPILQALGPSDSQDTASLVTEQLRAQGGWLSRCAGTGAG
jgi:hypothetical protein